MNEQYKSNDNSPPRLRSAFGNSLGNISICLALLAFGIGVAGKTMLASIEVPDRPRKIYDPGDLSVVTDKVSHSVRASVTIFEKIVLFLTGGFLLLCLNAAAFITGVVGCFRTPRIPAVLGISLTLLNLS